jgi:hypothetical protein
MGVQRGIASKLICDEEGIEDENTGKGKDS